MRQEASVEEWGNLYRTAAVMKELKPWEGFWDMDLFCIQEEEEKDAVFISILGRGGSCYGISVYEGYEGLNDFLMLTMHEKMNLTTEYTIFSQNSLTCYWGNREELSEGQRKIIKDAGYKFRGKNQWLYFMSYMEGFYPYNLDRDEVLRMTHYLTLLAQAVIYYRDNKLSVDFEKASMFLYCFSRQNKTWSGSEAPLPFVMYQFSNLMLTDDELMADLRKAKKGNHILEADLVYLGSSVRDKKYERPANPRMCLIGESASGLIFNADMIEPDEDANVFLAENIIGFIFRFGAPREIRVSNVIVAAAIEQICDLAGIRLRRVKTLPALSEFLVSMKNFQ